MIPRGNGFMPTKTVVELRALARKEKNPKAHLRLLAAIHRKEGWTLERISGALNRPVTTMHDWLLRLHDNNLDRLRDRKQPGRPPRLTRAQREQLVEELERGPPYNRQGLWTTKAVRELIRRKFGVTFAPQHAWRILVACGFSIQRPRPRHHKSASPDEIRQFKKKRGGGSDTIGRKVLTWARKMRPPLASSPS